MGTLGQNLLAWRTARRLTQTELASRAGLPRPTISFLESNRFDPTLSTIRRLSNALGITPGTLIDERPDPLALSRNDLDQIAREAIQPGAIRRARHPVARRLGRVIQNKVSARSGRIDSPVNRPHGRTALKLRAQLGEETWEALLRRVDKHLGAAGVPSHEK